MKRVLKVVFLGASNSITSGELESGLSEKASLLNLALRAFSSIQNLYQVISKKV
jgi:hypothetical protein